MITLLKYRLLIHQKIDYINHFLYPIILFPAQFYVVLERVIEDLNKFIQKFLRPFRAFKIDILQTPEMFGCLKQPLFDIEIVNFSRMLQNFSQSALKDFFCCNMKRLKRNKHQKGITFQMKAEVNYFRTYRPEYSLEEDKINFYNYMILRDNLKDEWLPKFR